MHNRIFFFAFLFVGGSLALPHVAHAASIPFFGPIVPDAVNRCAAGWSQIIVIINNIIRFLLTLAIVFILPIMIAYAGFLFVVNPVSPSGKQKAKDVLTSTIIGIAIAFSGWLIVDALMAVMVPNGQPFGQNWASIVNWSGDACLPMKGSLYQLNESVNAVTGGVTGVSGSGVVTTSSGYTFDPGIDAQMPTASAALNSLLSCMRDKLPSGVGRISSISDSQIVNGKSFAQCAASGCSHTANSCHYGGRTCIGESYAVDFGDQQNAHALATAALSCNSQAFINYEGTHLHVSVGAASGCGCDTGPGIPIP